ncbi:hypothetical protein Goshw_016905 [Gossypium schwendimanii]|uniref:Uncharacterized protein n=1 Tax=Gossypium schwendimanii TaxID=34291 RepID=A0A7J9N868_GOSSC|nr:hypothetical protein [Gossypium schwendimanii]
MQAHQRGPDIHPAHHHRLYNHQAQQQHQHSHSTQQFNRRYPRCIGQCRTRDRKRGRHGALLFTKSHDRMGFKQLCRW